MPITLLHFGLLAPVNQLAPRKVSNISFILVNLWIDAPAITHWFQGLPLPSHNEDIHTLHGAMFLAVLIAVLGVRSSRWVLGAFLGAITHILLDGLVHAEMVPLYPMAGNPLYMGWMEPLSLALLPLTVWLIVQSVSGSLGWVRKHWEAFQARNSGSSV